jgi:carbamoyl-phosphate synthase small subunit
MKGALVLKNGKQFTGESFGSQVSRSGELVFATGMTGYVEAFTDPSFAGQILVMTYPLIGSYGVQPEPTWESKKIHIAGLIVSDYIDTPSHYDSKQTLSSWLKSQNVPALEITDTRMLTQMIRDHGSLLSKIILENTDVPFEDPNKRNLAAEVSTQEVEYAGPQNAQKTIVVIDCGAKRNIIHSLVGRGVRVITVPWNYDIFSLKEKFDGVLISNGPGDPKMATTTIETIKKIITQKIPTLGICLGNQLLTLAAGGNTKKMKFGHRSQNQPVIMAKSDRCYLTTQNHGFVVDTIPHGFDVWFTNANDGTNEGIKHKTLPIMSVQFHPEACPGPTDTDWIFDYFLEKTA